MSDKYTPAIVDALYGVDFRRAELAGLIELLDGADPRQGNINQALTRLRECRHLLSDTLNWESQS